MSDNAYPTSVLIAELRSAAGDDQMPDRARNLMASAAYALELAEKDYTIPRDQIIEATKVYGVAREYVDGGTAEILDRMHEQYLGLMLDEAHREGFLLIELPERTMTEGPAHRPWENVTFKLTAKVRKIR